MSKINKISVDGISYDIEDASIPNWAKSSVKPTYKTSELENDSNFITETKVDEKIANVASGGSIDLSNYATKEYVNEQISNIEASGGSSLDIFSTEETKIGTWINGKPIYRKVIIGTTITTLDTWNKIADVEFDEIVSMQCVATSVNENYPSNEANIPIIAMKNTKQLYEKHFNEFWSGKQYKVILEFTKPND